MSSQPELREGTREEKDLLRFVTVGSVDDGKSTLIGRLLHDSHGLYEDQLRAVQRASQKSKGAPDAEIDFSLFTDGLKAEREQGITIDVAYRYFATAKRKFIIADTPGHVQYTRNMATGASTADVAIILIDARLGVLTQSRRHAYIASLLGIRHLLVGVNKMDLVGWDSAVFDAIRAEFGAFAARLGFEGASFIPISALRGDNVVEKSARTPFYRGPTVLGLLEDLPPTLADDDAPFRFPVQTVLRPSLDYRGYAGQIASGVVRPGDTVMVLPSRRTTRVLAIDTYAGSVDVAFAPMSVALRLVDEVDVSRGEMLVDPRAAPRVEQRFDAMLVWMHERPLDREKSYLLKHTTQTVRAEIEAVPYQVDLDTLEHVRADTLGLNDIGRVTVRAHRPLFVDEYRANRTTGAFILVDSLTNDTVAAGMIQGAREGAPSQARVQSSGVSSVGAQDTATPSQVSPTERRERVGHRAVALVVSPDVLYAVERHLFDRRYIAAVAATAADAAALVAAGLVAVCAFDELETSALIARLGEYRVVRAGAASNEGDACAAAVGAIERAEALACEA